MNIATYFKTFILFLNRNYKFVFGVVLTLLFVIIGIQHNQLQDLKRVIENKDITIENEYNRYINNITNLKDSITFVKEDNVYVKTLLKVKEDELEELNQELSEIKKELEDVIDELDNKSEIKNIYITEIESKIETADILTKVDVDDDNNFSVGISDSNMVVSIDTRTWFKLVPNGDKMKLVLVNKYGENKPSFLDYHINFSLILSQYQTENGGTRVVVKPQTIDGRPIPPDVLNIPFVNGVDFMDVQTETPPFNGEKSSRYGLGVTIGPSYGLYLSNGSFIPTLGIGIMVGYTYKIF